MLSPSVLLDRIEENFLGDGIFDTLDDAHGGVVAIGKAFVRSFTHKRPLVFREIPLALDDLFVVLFQAFRDFHLAERLLTAADVEKSLGFR